MKIQRGATHLLMHHMCEPSQVRVVDGNMFTAGGYGSWSYMQWGDLELIESELIELHPKYSEGYEDES